MDPTADQDDAPVVETTMCDADSPVVETTMCDADGAIIHKGDIVTVKFRIVGFDGGLLLVEPVRTPTEGLPGLTAISPTHATKHGILEGTVNATVNATVNVPEQNSADLKEV